MAIQQVKIQVRLGTPEVRQAQQIERTGLHRIRQQRGNRSSRQRFQGSTQTGTRNVDQRPRYMGSANSPPTQARLVTICLKP